MSIGEKDRRRHPRHPFQCQVILYQPSGRAVKATTRDISWGGIGIVSEEELTNGAMVNVYANLDPSMKCRRAYFATQVRHIVLTENLHNIGLQFPFLVPSAKRCLELIIDKHPVG